MKVIRTGFLAIMFLTLFGGGRILLCDSLSWIGIDLHEHHHCDEPADCDSNRDHEEEKCDCGSDALLLQLTTAFPSLESHLVEVPPLVSDGEHSLCPRAFAFLKVSHPPPLKNSGAISCVLLQRFTI